MKESASACSINAVLKPILALIAVMSFAFTPARTASAQAKETATRAGDLQVGAAFLFGQSSNTQTIPSTSPTLPGYAIYAVFDKREHLGVEADFRQITTSNGTHISERTYEIGGRYVRHYGNFSPYAKLLFGRGVYNYPGDVAKLAYNIFTGGAGADVRVSYSINVRIDYEYQTWMSFPRSDLHPGVLAIGIAYHFPQYCGNSICPK